MATHFQSVIFDSLTADPSPPVDGQFWHNSTTDTFKVRLDGVTHTLAHDSDVSAHTGASGNPHTVTLEQARTAGSSVAGDIDMGSNSIVNVQDPVSAQDVATLSFVNARIQQFINGFEWKDGVLDKDLSTPPGAPTTGDRYIVGGSPTGDWVGQANALAEWDGAAWTFDAVASGDSVHVADESRMYRYNGSAWEVIEISMDHGSMTGLGDDDHAQYLPVSGSRAMSGDLDMGGQAVTNVGNVDGVDVGAHASRHESGGADEIDGDHLDIDYTPTNYSPTTVPAEAGNVDHLAAHLAGIDSALTGGGGGLQNKAGNVAVGSFAGNPKEATVTFSAAFSNTNYAVVLSHRVQNQASYMVSYHTKTVSGFTILVDADNVSDLLAVDWVATSNGEAS